MLSPISIYLLTILDEFWSYFGRTGKSRQFKNIQPTTWSLLLRKKFKNRLSSAYVKKMAIIHQENATLERLVSGGIHPSTTVSNSDRNSALKVTLGRVTKSNKVVRKHAAHLYDLLAEKFREPHCTCEHSHYVGMRLEERSKIDVQSILSIARRNDCGDGHSFCSHLDTDNYEPPSLRFRFLFSFKGEQIEAAQQQLPTMMSQKFTELEIARLEPSDQGKLYARQQSSRNPLLFHNRSHSDSNFHSTSATFSQVFTPNVQGPSRIERKNRCLEGSPVDKKTVTLEVDRARYSDR